MSSAMINLERWQALIHITTCWQLPSDGRPMADHIFALRAQCGNQTLGFLVCVPFFQVPHSKGSLHHCFFFFPWFFLDSCDGPHQKGRTARILGLAPLRARPRISVAFVSFRFCDLIVDRDAFITVSFILRATSAIGGAAAETSAMSILLGKYPDNTGTVSVCGILFVEFKLHFIMNTFLALPWRYYIW